MSILRPVIVASGTLLVAVLGVSAFETHILKATPERCQALTAIQSRLTRGMARAEVERVVEEEHAAFIRRNDQGEFLTLWANAGRMRVCKLVLSFDEARLEHARMDTESWRAGKPPACPGF